MSEQEKFGIVVMLAGVLGLLTFEIRKAGGSMEFSLVALGLIQFLVGVVLFCFG